MKSIFLFCCCVCSSFLLVAQRDFTPGKRRADVFGQADYRNYRYAGLQISAGQTFLFTRSDSKNPLYLSTAADGRPMDYRFDPSGKLGMFAEIGMAHFPKKRAKLSLALKTVLVSYYDWALGVKFFGGSEQTTTRYYNAFGQLSVTEYGSADFFKGYCYGRFTLHKNINLSKRYFIDNGLGLNFDYAIVQGNQIYKGVTVNPLVFQKSCVVQAHYDLGFGVKLGRGSFFIPGVQVPILGLYEWRGGCAALKWYHSNYVPFLAHVKFIYLFQKHAKGCNTPGTEEDRKKNEQYLNQH